MKFLVFLAAGIAVGLILLLVLHRAQFVYRPEPLDEARYRALAAAPGWRAEPLDVGDGVTLPGLVRTPQSPDAPWLLLLPGNGADVLASGQALLAAIAGDADLGLAVWTWRGFDGAAGTPDVLRFGTDVEAQHRHLRRRLGARRVHVVSFSLGTALNLRLASLRQEAGEEPTRLVLLSAYDAITVRKPVWYGRLAPPDRYDALAWASGVQAEALMVHGTADSAIPLAAAHRLRAALGDRVRLVELPGRGHADWLADPAVCAQIRTFLLGA